MRFLRKTKTISQAKAAALVHVSQRAYCDYESGRLNIPLCKLIVLAKYYNCSIDYISGASNICRKFPEV